MGLNKLLQNCRLVGASGILLAWECALHALISVVLVETVLVDW